MQEGLFKIIQSYLERYFSDSALVIKTDNDIKILDYYDQKNIYCYIYNGIITIIYYGVISDIICSFEEFDKFMSFNVPIGSLNFIPIEIFYKSNFIK